MLLMLMMLLTEMQQYMLIIIIIIDHVIDKIMYVSWAGPLELPFLTLLERFGWKLSRNVSFRHTPSFGAHLRQIKEIGQE